MTTVTVMITLKVLDQKNGDLTSCVTVDEAINTMREKAGNGYVVIDVDNQRCISNEEIDSVQDGSIVLITPPILGG